MAQDRRRVRPGLLPAASGQGERIDVLRSLPWGVAVVPLRVAWIEIYDVDLTNVVTRMSQPSRVAWIEIMQTAAMRIKQAIATREGCVD